MTSLETGNPERPTLRRAASVLAGAVIALALSGGVAAAADCRSDAEQGVDWTDCDKHLLILSGSTLSGAILTGVDFTSTDLRESNLLTANFEKAKLVRASLADSDAKGANFSRIEGYRTDFSRIDAQGAKFRSAEMQRSNFTGAKLSNVDFTKAELGRADFTDADISGSQFALTNLARADFRAAHFTAPIDFENSFFFLTRIDGVDLSKATGLTQWQIDMSCGDDKTVLPTGLTHGKLWPCQFDKD